MKQIYIEFNQYKLLHVSVIAFYENIIVLGQFCLYAYKLLLLLGLNLFDFILPTIIDEAL